jgi:hypothetical protein
VSASEARTTWMGARRRVMGGDLAAWGNIADSRAWRCGNAGADRRA